MSCPGCRRRELKSFGDGDTAPAAKAVGEGAEEYPKVSISGELEEGMKMRKKELGACVSLS
jgi:hypothetical protein